MRNDQTDGSWDRRRLLRAGAMSGALVWFAPVITSISSPAAAASALPSGARPLVQLHVTSEHFGDDTGEMAGFNMFVVVHWKGLPVGNIVWEVDHYHEYAVSGDHGERFFFSVTQSNQANPTTLRVYAETVDHDGHPVRSNVVTRSWDIKCPYFDHDGNRLDC